MRVTVLGGGRVGSAIVRDLARDGEFEVTVADASQAALERLAGEDGVTVVRCDLGDPVEVRRIVVGGDLAVGAVPGFMGFAALRAVIQAGVSVVDISFFPEDPFELDGLAREAGVIAVVDCGVAPGCSNLIAGRLEAEFERLERFACYVGGLPVERRWPWEYKAPFSPVDVIEEYLRPARYVAHGAPVSVPALAEPELLDFPGVGTLEAFATDGLRTLLRTVRAPFMVEKTLRYPGHVEKIRTLRASGFFSEEPVEVGGVRVRPRDLTARLLFPAWELNDGDEDVTVMRVIGEGSLAGRRIRRTLDLFDRYDEATRTSSMARTTGYTCTAAVRLLASGGWSEPGVIPPELLGRRAECYDSILGDLARRGVVFRAREETVP
jgi:saccharopine dehydrogenase-like NADP-dependent oxidoreductase